jgi:GAF domain-containing protein
VAQQRRSIVNGNPTVEPNLRNGNGIFAPNGSVLSIPLSDEHDNLLGVFTIYSSRHAAFSQEHLRIVQELQPRITALMCVTPGAGDLTVLEGKSL